MIKKVFVYLLGLFFIPSVSAQNGDVVYSFLRLPVSPYVSALGGTNISLISEDNSNAFQNPALLTHTTDKLLSLNYMNYVSDINIGSVLFSKAASSRAVWGVGMIYSDYGSFVESTNDNTILGSFGAKDMALNGIYSYKLTDYLSGGFTGKAVYSSFVDYSSFALCVDLGLNYYDENNNISASLALKNIGGQIVKYDNESEKMPWDFQIGISKKFAHAPFRFHLTGRYLNVWDMSLNRTTVNYTAGEATTYYDTTFGTIVKHFIFGFDFLPSKNFYVAVGYNPKAADDFKVSEKKGLYGFTIGTGFKIKRFQIGTSLSQQHVGATTLMVGVTTDLRKF